MKKSIVTDVALTDTLKSLNKMIDNLSVKKNHSREAIVKIIFNHLGFTIAYIDGEKELNKIVADIKKDLKDFLKEEKEEVAFGKALEKAKAKTNASANSKTKKSSKAKKVSKKK